MTTKNCPFCVVRPAGHIAERELATLIWDAFPVSKGHALVIPRRHIESWFDATKDELAQCGELVQVARLLIDDSYSPGGYNIGANVGTAAGQTVPHAHLHIIPRYTGDVPDPTGGVRGVIPPMANYLNPEEPKPPAVQLSGAAGSLVSGAPNDPLLPHLIRELDRATQVDIVAAFVLQGGVNLLREHFVDVLDRGGRVRVLTGDYFSVTEPSALRTLLDLQGDIEVRAYQTTPDLSFHPKAYILFSGPGDGVAFVGSSNLSKTALLNGVEWNYRILHAGDDVGFGEVRDSYEALWDDARTSLVDEAWIEGYEQRRRPAPESESGVDLEPEPPPTPHPLQRRALVALDDTRAEGNTAGLVVLATGLGKTWLSAFDSAREEFGSVLFVAHREEILRQAMRTFRRIRPNASLGLYNGQVKQAEADVLFASIQTLSRTRHLHDFDRHAFDYIVVDEFHHASAKTYRRVINYFEPRFLLGLTATPERTDGADLLALCGENLVFRADVAEGIRKELLSPFDYYGVPDLVDYDKIPWRSSRFDEEALTRSVATLERARNALEQLEKYGGGRTLAFCVSQTHADFMAGFFRDFGLDAVAVHSGPTSAPRAHSLERLQSGDLDVVFAVDMFNEGVDLPDLATVLMLRPTESRILWLQQFGRGLRYRKGKKLKVIDYIGNHRIFLTKTQALLGLGRAEREVAHALERLDAGTWELPPGCSVTYELEAKEILRSLIPAAPAGDRLQEYYREFRDLNGVRPLASQAFLDGLNPRSPRRAGLGDSWLAFVDYMGDLSAAEQEVLGDHEHFFTQLGVTRMVRSYKMLVLLAMLGAEALPGEIHIDELVERFGELARRYTPLRAEVGERLNDPPSLRRLIVDNPIDAWCGAGSMGERPYFEFDGTHFSTRLTLLEAQREAFRDCVQEIAEWRLLEYLQRADTQLGPDYFVCNVSHADGRPMLFLPSRDKVAGLPHGWTDVFVDDRTLQANFVKIALNVVTEPGEEENQLPAILREWFGSGTGAPGRSDRVVFQARDGAYVMRPWFAEDAKQKGPLLWQRYTRDEAFKTLRIEAKGWDRQTGVIERSDQFAFFVTLDKRGKAETQHYEDEFLSSSEFQWQSQNRTLRDSARGRRYEAEPETGVPIHLFVRARAKTGSKTNPFLYAGRLHFLRWEGDKPITIWWRLGEAIPERLWSELRIPVRSD